MVWQGGDDIGGVMRSGGRRDVDTRQETERETERETESWLVYTSEVADEERGVELGERVINKEYVNAAA